MSRTVFASPFSRSFPLNGAPQRATKDTRIERVLLGALGRGGARRGSHAQRGTLVSGAFACAPLPIVPCRCCVRCGERTSCLSDGRVAHCASPNLKAKVSLAKPTQKRLHAVSDALPASATKKLTVKGAIDSARFRKLNAQRPRWTRRISFASLALLPHPVSRSSALRVANNATFRSLTTIAESDLGDQGAATVARILATSKSLKELELNRSCSLGRKI